MVQKVGLVTASTVRAIDLRYLERWNAGRRQAPLEEMGVDEICFGKQMKFITVVSNLETGWGYDAHSWSDTQAHSMAIRALKEHSRDFAVLHGGGALHAVLNRLLGQIFSRSHRMLGI
jgi:hypothetical protein